MDSTNAVLRYRGRVVTAADIKFIRALIADHPGATRRALSQRLCEAWSMVQPNGAPRDMVCRGLMLTLWRAGHLSLPPPHHVPPNPLARRRTAAPVEVECTPLVARLAELGQIELVQVRRTPAEALFNGLIEAHHYLGYTQPVGEHLKYLVYAQGRALACFAWSSAPRHLGPRDGFIGWSAEARRRNIRFIAYNSRFLILPWVRVPHLASHLLARMTRMLSQEWQRIYGHPVYFAETFVDPERFRGTCYRAANWMPLGRTTGRGHNAQTWRATQPKKDVLGLPLVRNFRRLLSA